MRSTASIIAKCISWPWTISGRLFPSVINPVLPASLATALAVASAVAVVSQLYGRS